MPQNYTEYIPRVISKDWPPGVGVRVKIPASECNEESTCDDAFKRGTVVLIQDGSFTVAIDCTYETVPIKTDDHSRDLWGKIATFGAIDPKDPSETPVDKQAAMPVHLPYGLKPVEAMFVGNRKMIGSWTMMAGLSATCRSQYQIAG